MSGKQGGDPGLARLNLLPRDGAAVSLKDCCGSGEWVQRMMQYWPFLDRDHLFKIAERYWWTLTPTAWQEAFAQHPRIGDRGSQGQPSDTASAWAQTEQSRVSGISQVSRDALAEGQRVYERKFGYIFIVCATGKTAAEMLDSLEQRIGNDPATELAVAAGEQMKITRLRLEKLLDEAP